MIVFKNRGLIDLRAVTTFGVSAKGDNKSAIGYFGTGLKYAIAITLRHGGRISVWRGLEEYRFTVERDEVRGQEFGFVYMERFWEGGREDRERLGFTTHLGANWQPWQAFREVYCNCLDEGGTVDQEGTPEDGYTTVTVADFGDFAQAFRDRHQIVLTDTPAFINDCVNVRLRPAQHIFYRGVRVMELRRPSERTYDLVQSTPLTEDRTLKYEHQAEQYVANSVLRSQDPRYITTMLRTPNTHWEHHLNYAQSYLDEPSDVFLDTVAELAQDQTLPLNPTALTLLYKKREFHHKLQPVQLTPTEAAQLDFAYRALRLMGYEVKNPVTVVETLGSGVLGKAYLIEGTIALSRRAFEIGTKCVVGTLLEEHLHLQHQYQDETRDFQNYLLDRLITVALDHYMPGELA